MRSSSTETVRIVLGATEKAVSGDPRALGWDWDDEKLTVERMCASFISKNRELSCCLEEELREQFEQKYDQGREPYLVYRRDRGWQVAAKKGMGDRSLRRLAKAHAVAVGGGNSAVGSSQMTSYPFKLFHFGALTRPRCRVASGYTLRTINAALSPPRLAPAAWANRHSTLSNSLPSAPGGPSC